MAARKKKLRLGQEWRDRIQVSQVMNRLLKCFNGEIELRPDQLKSIELILRKVVPDLSKVEQQHLDKEGNPTDPEIIVKYVE